MAGKKNKKGRATGGMMLGVRKGLNVISDREGREREGIMEAKVKLGKEWWRVVGIYVNKDLEAKLEVLREILEEKEEGWRVLIGGDFNVRTGREGGGFVEGENRGEVKENIRRSKDGKVNSEGWNLYEFLGEYGWEILNGNTRGDEEGEWTYTRGRGESVIDYALGDEKTRERG